MIRRSKVINAAWLVYCLVSVSGGIVRPRSGTVVRGEDPSCESKAQRVNSVCQRGGGDNVAVAEEVIKSYLQSHPSDTQFQVQGWRWHTMSLVREAKQLEKLAVNMQNEQTERGVEDLKKAADYVIGFNMKGLHKIERDLFFPWVRQKISALKEPDVVKSFSIIMDHLEMDRRNIEKLGSSLIDSVTVASNSVISLGSRQRAIGDVASKSASIAETARSMLQREDSLLIPVLCRVVPESEQKSFNNKVIRNLGVWDSRMYLVGMHEAVEELNDNSERKLFEEMIPSIPRMMIPRWKRNLYGPRIGDIFRLRSQ